jgi:hypothetical protein
MFSQVGRTKYGTMEKKIAAIENTKGALIPPPKKKKNCV